MDVTKQIRKDLLREIVEINGSKFSDHTKDEGEMDMFESVETILDSTIDRAQEQQLPR